MSSSQHSEVASCMMSVQGDDVEQGKVSEKMIKWPSGEMTGFINFFLAKKEQFLAHLILFVELNIAFLDKMDPSAIISNVYRLNSTMCRFITILPTKPMGWIHGEIEIRRK